MMNMLMMMMRRMIIIRLDVVGDGLIGLPIYHHICLDTIVCIMMMFLLIVMMNWLMMMMRMMKVMIIQLGVVGDRLISLPLYHHICLDTIIWIMMMFLFLLIVMMNMPMMMMRMMMMIIIIQLNVVGDRLIGLPIYHHICLDTIVWFMMMFLLIVMMNMLMIMMRMMMIMIIQLGVVGDRLISLPLYHHICLDTIIWIMMMFLFLLIVMMNMPMMMMRMMMMIIIIQLNVVGDRLIGLPIYHHICLDTIVWFMMMFLLIVMMNMLMIMMRMMMIMIIQLDAVGDEADDHDGVVDDEHADDEDHDNQT